MSTLQSDPHRIPFPLDPVIEAYKKDVDVTLIDYFQRLTPEERLISLQNTLADVTEMREAMKKTLAQARDSERR